MNHSAKLERIRRFVRQTFSDLAADAPSPIRESILVQNGHYCGRRFSGDKIHAVWFVEEGELKFYGADGSVLKVTTADVDAEQRGRAAA
jgi:hypothetical protein